MKLPFESALAETASCLTGLISPFALGFQVAEPLADQQYGTAGRRMESGKVLPQRKLAQASQSCPFLLPDIGYIEMVFISVTA